MQTNFIYCLRFYCCCYRDLSSVVYRLKLLHTGIMRHEKQQQVQKVRTQSKPRHTLGITSLCLTHVDCFTATWPNCCWGCKKFMPTPQSTWVAGSTLHSESGINFACHSWLHVKSGPHALLLLLFSLPFVCRRRNLKSTCCCCCCCDLFNQLVRQVAFIIQTSFVAASLGLLFVLFHFRLFALCEFNVASFVLARLAQAFLPHLICIIFMKISATTTKSCQCLSWLRHTRRMRNAAQCCCILLGGAVC